MLPEVANIDDWVAVTEVVGVLVLAVQLRAVARFHVPSVVLVEVVQLVVDVDGALDFVRDLVEVEGAIFLFFSVWVILKLHIILTLLIVLGATFENLFTENV